MSLHACARVRACVRVGVCVRVCVHMCMFWQSEGIPVVRLPDRRVSLVLLFAWDSAIIHIPMTSHCSSLLFICFLIAIYRYLVWYFFSTTVSRVYREKVPLLV